MALPGIALECEEIDGVPWAAANGFHKVLKILFFMKKRIGRYQQHTNVSRGRVQLNFQSRCLSVKLISVHRDAVVNRLDIAFQAMHNQTTEIELVSCQ